MSIALHYHPEGYSVQGPTLMGRQAAGESFLRGFLKHGPAGHLWVEVERQEHAATFRDAARALGRQDPVHMVETHAPAGLAEVGALYLPGPELARAAWKRQTAGGMAWSLCGVTHTTASAAAMDAITECLSAPVQPWDALICTSNAVRANVEGLLESQQAYLSERLGATRFPRPMLPVIPLGIHTADFAHDASTRARSRGELGLGPDDVAVLYVGRLSFHAKAHPLAMYQALEQAATQQPGRRITLVECGWFANDALRQAFDEAATAACPGVRRVVLDGRDAAARTRAWAAADLFCSLSDNIQETFGLAPVEAMAAGLPVVVSDWDGYRDTVRDGVDGFRVPTWLAPPGTGRDLAARHAVGEDSYDRYCGYTSAFVAVDVGRAATALSALIGSAELRQRMGAAGREQARRRFDWAVIMGRYQALWDEQRAQRAVAATGAATSARWPARPDPFEAFSAYPSRPLRAGTQVTLAGGASRLAPWRSLAMVRFADVVLPDPRRVDRWLQALASGPVTMKALLDQTPAAERGELARGLVWLAKLGVVSLSDPAD